MVKLGHFRFMLVMMAVFYTLAIVLWQVTGAIFYLLNFAIIGISIGLGAGLWPVLPKAKKHLAHRVSQLLVGGYLFFGLGMGLIYFCFGVFQPENMQIEGFWFWLLAGLAYASVMHYLIAKIFGPLIFGRGWCGWACWTAGVLDLLPWRLSPGRAAPKWGHLRYLHFAFAAALVFVLVYAFHYTRSDTFGGVLLDSTLTSNERQYASLWQVPELWWFLIGNLFYFTAGIILAYALKDNRAFCKYLCPITAFLKPGAHLAVLKVGAKKELCTQCGLCEKNCPMDIKLMEYIQQGQRITSSECIICQTCIGVCPKDALRLNFKFDAGFKERLRCRPDIKK